MDRTTQFAVELIETESVTPNDGGCQDMMAERLEAVGFSIEHMPFAEEGGEGDERDEGGQDDEGNESDECVR